MPYGSDAWWHWFWFCVLHWLVFSWRTQRRWLGPLLVDVGKALVQLLLMSGAMLFLLCLVSAMWPCCGMRHTGQVTACKSNLKNIGTASEMYSTDNAGDYAPQITMLTPNYLKTIPTCASASASTYLQGYVAINRHSTSGAYNAYTVVCAGTYHCGVNLGPNYPQYTSAQGLISM